MIKKYVLVSTYGWEAYVENFESFEQAEKEMIKRFCEEINYRTDDYINELQSLLDNGDIILENNWGFISYDYSKSGCMVDFSISELL